MELKQGIDRFTPLPQETLDLIVMYRQEHKLSYRAIEKRLGVSRETARKHCIKVIPEESNKTVKVTKPKVKNNIVTKKKKPLPQYNSVRDYDFLQYIRIVFKWAVKDNPTLSRAKIEMLLYLYPKGAFTYSQFHKFYKTIGIYQSKALAEFVENGYIKVWKNRTGRSPKLYALTDKSKMLCDTMHKYCTGEKDLPIDEDNSLVTDKEVRINRYYVDMIKDMNKRKKVAK